MGEFFNSLQVLVDVSKANVNLLLTIIGGIWAFNLVNAVLGWRLNVLGIYPRTGHGLIGIFFSPILHGGFEHLLFNSIPLFVLGNFILLKGVSVFYGVSILIILLTGIFIWMIGRPAIHIGASGVITGYFGYLLMDAFEHPTVVTVVIAIVAIYYFGGIISGLLPSHEEPEVSWEGHLVGLVAGLATSYIYPSLAPTLNEMLAQWVK